MKVVLAVGLALAAAPLAAATAVKSLPGVSDEETTIPGGVKQTLRGHGDVIYVRNRTNRWYRVELNEGCAGGTSDMNQVIFRHSRGHPGNRIDRFTSVIFGGAMRSCAIKSIRKSEAPPQVDSKSRVTLD